MKLRLRALALAGLLELLLAGVVLAAGPEPSPSPSPGPSPSPSPAPVAAALPQPGDRLPRGPRALAAALDRTTADLNGAIDRWRGDGDPSRGGPPEDVTLLALHQQRIYRLLTRRVRLSRAVIRRLPRRLRAAARDNVLARRELARIVSVHHGPPPRIDVGPAQPADVLRGHYRRAWKRFRVGPPLLAAVNFVESAFGKLRNRSVSGARGPMQFMPATWRAYGLGGDIQDPRDAILGAANYLHASGAPGDERGALHHYNPSPLYVSAVARYARRIRVDVRAFYAYYAWQVYVGGRRLSGPR
ncbi:MAG TPA: lytic transglycosylase domain-containing protein [Solirubrobacteraceae bacterium]